jgi:hypothetical protein
MNIRLSRQKTEVWGLLCVQRPASSRSLVDLAHAVSTSENFAMRQNNTASRINTQASNAQTPMAHGVTLSDGKTIDAKTFDAHIQRFQTSTGNTTTGPGAAALWFATQNRRT